MEQSQLRDWERRCIQEEQPWCQAACPLHVDVRAFMARMASGDPDGARKVLEKTMPLPGVLGLICDHPCEARCKRAEAGSPLAVGELERAAIRLGRPGPKPLVLPSKGKKAAVFGAGLAALACAWDLTRKGHGVTLFCPGAKPGGRLSTLPESILPPQALTREIERLAAMGVTLRDDGGYPSGILEEVLAGFDAVFAEWGTPFCPPGRAQADPVTLQATGSPVFCGGWPGEGGRFSAMAEAADGRRAASSMDRLMAGASLTAERDREGPCETRLFTSLQGVESLPRVEPSGPQGYADAAEAAREAARCLDCQCLECVKACAYLERYKGYPKKYARQIYNNAAIVQGVHQANRMINSCSRCGLCAHVCPENFDMGALCMEARRDMVARGKMPPSAHEFALEDMAFNCGPDFFLARNQPGFASSAHLFFPGCQLASSYPHHAVSAYAFLRERLSGGVGLMLSCCGVPAEWAGREDLFEEAAGRIVESWKALGSPRVVAACASCLATFRQRLPELRAVSLWEALAETGLPEARGARPRAPVAVHDPCSLRREPEVRGRVRAVLGELGLAFEELPRGGSETECCGYGGLMSSVDPGLARELARRKAAESPLDYAASCAMCRDRLAAEGKRAWHVLDFVFEGPAPDPALKGPGFSERHERRARLKRALLRDVWDEAPEEAGQAPMDLVFVPGVAGMLEDRRILVEDARAVLRASLGSNEGFKDLETGRVLAVNRPRKVTYWVEYSRDGGAATVHRAWSHRMEIQRASAGDPGSNPLVYLPESGQWSCLCGEPLVARPVEASYLGSGFTITLLACPRCGLALVPESLATGKMAEVEMLLEDK